MTNKDKESYESVPPCAHHPVHIFTLKSNVLNRRIYLEYLYSAGAMHFVDMHDIYMHFVYIPFIYTEDIYMLQACAPSEY